MVRTLCEKDPVAQDLKRRFANQQEIIRNLQAENERLKQMHGTEPHVPSTSASGASEPTSGTNDVPPPQPPPAATTRVVAPPAATTLVGQEAYDYYHPAPAAVQLPNRYPASLGFSNPYYRGGKIQKIKRSTKSLKKKNKRSKSKRSKRFRKQRRK